MVQKPKADGRLMEITQNFDKHVSDLKFFWVRISVRKNDSWQVLIIVILGLAVNRS